MPYIGCPSLLHVLFSLSPISRKARSGKVVCPGLIGAAPKIRILCNINSDANTFQSMCMTIITPLRLCLVPRRSVRCNVYACRSSPQTTHREETTLMKTSRNCTWLSLRANQRKTLERSINENTIIITLPRIQGRLR